jgi:hypothetical protein
MTCSIWCRKLAVWPQLSLTRQWFPNRNFQSF